MKTFLYHETSHCEVTFVRRITAETEEEAFEIAFEGGGDLLGVAVGDDFPSGVFDSQILSDESHNIPAHFYKEPEA